MRLRTRRPVSAGGDAPTPEDVELVYGGLLGRAPSDGEVAHWLATAPDLRGLLHAVAASEEHRRRVVPVPAPETEPHLVNVWHEDLADAGHAPGTWSPDGVAVVGREGYVFIGQGSNSVLDQYRGTVQLPDDWLARWTEAVARRRDGCAALGAAYAGIVIPDKLGVLTDRFPQELPAGVVAPAAQLAAAPGLDLLFPVDQLRAVPGGAYLRSDSHLTYAGNAALARAVGVRLGLASDLGDTDVELVRYAISGDLGSRFRPAIVEVTTTATTLGGAVIVEDNRDELIAVGGHIGSRRVLRNESAADPRTAVVFGDSYAFPDASYQGLAWFLAQAFREVHSLWVPFGWDPAYVEGVGAGVVVCQVAERFVVRPPAPQVDAVGLAAETIARRSGITIEELDGMPGS